MQEYPPSFVKTIFLTRTEKNDNKRLKSSECHKKVLNHCSSLSTLDKGCKGIGKGLEKKGRNEVYFLFEKKFNNEET